MSYLKGFITTLLLILISVLIIIGVNFLIDNHAVRLSLFGIDKEIHRPFYPDHSNAKILHPEAVLRNPERFDSFLFGSSRTSGIHVENIPTGRYYNMSYVSGSIAEHRDIVKAFLKKGVKIKTVVIGLDEIYFNLPASARQNHRLNIMHPDAGGPGRLQIFFTYFFRIPDMIELLLWRERALLNEMRGRIILNREGVNLAWQQDDRKTGKAKEPTFKFFFYKYKPIIYNPSDVNDALSAIQELVALSNEHHFSLILFINPFSAQLYLNNAEPLFNVKERLAMLTDYYDFSGLNSVTTDSANYVEESHYRCWIGDQIAERIFGSGRVKIPDDFGIRVGKQNVGRHLENQRRELEQYLKAHHLK